MNITFPKIIWLLLFTFYNIVSAEAQQLISSEPKGTFTKEELNAQYGPFFENGVKLHKILYTTPDLQGVTDTASGLLMIPDRPNAVMPLLCAQHGTVTSKTDVPSNLQGGYELGAVFAGLGYVTVMPDFLGLGESRGFHPYVHAASEASASLDMLLATQEYAAQNNIALNDQLFITGYSQGGHAAMALHREIELNKGDLFKVTAASHMSGPYSISGVMRDLIIGDTPYFFPAYVPFTIISYDEVYNIFENLDDIFKPAYANLIEKFYDGTFTLSKVNELLIDLLQTSEGASIPKFMFQDSVLNAVLADPNHPFNVALRDNDVYEWAPQAPTRLIYCTADDQVPFRNSIVADSVMNVLGAPDVMSIDANSAADHGGCVFPAVLQTFLFFNQYKSITTDVNEFVILQDVKIYPNPASDLININNISDNSIVQIIDFEGRIRKSKQSQSDSITIDLKNLNKGFYVLKIISDKGSWLGKIVIY